MPKKVLAYSRLIVLAHSVFALPFGVWGYAIGTREVGFSWSKLGWVLLAMVSARTSAMAFNRYADRRWDARNPRTQNREIPRGEVKPQEALLLSLAATGVFWGAAWALSPLCGLLAPVAILILLGYSYTKRFTSAAHFVLGAALGLAPIGAYVAITERFSWEIFIIGIAVLFWVAGFDILYALQDIVFDRTEGLFSLPAQFGEAAARRLSFLSHGTATLLLAIVGWRLYELNWLYWIGWGGFTGFVFWQHRIAQEASRINRAFFTHNGWASITLCSFAVSATFGLGT